MFVHPGLQDCNWCIVLSSVRPSYCPECEDNFCKASHRSIAYNRADLARTGAYIVYTDFLHFVSVVFDPRFLWKFELYIEALYHAYGADKTIVARHVRRTFAHCEYCFWDTNEACCEMVLLFNLFIQPMYCRMR